MLKSDLKINPKNGTVVFNRVTWTLISTIILCQIYEGEEFREQAPLTEIHFQMFFGNLLDVM